MPLAAPLDYFLHSAGPAARQVQILGWVFAGICSFVCILILVLLLISIFRKRPREAAHDIERSGNGQKWVFIGTAVSTAVLFLMTIYALIVLDKVSAVPAAPALTIIVTGYQWWWKAEYYKGDPAREFVTANEIHIPAGQPVLIKLISADVIHAFWVPQLAGKTQMIPGMINRQWLQADKPGIYWGQCTQYCGTQHAHMSFEVIAETPAEFDGWVKAQRQPSSADGQSRGAEIFRRNCAGCHSVRGTSFAGDHAPDLTHLMSRHRLAAGLLDNTRDNLENWIMHTQELKPDARMPDFDLPPQDRQALISYLSGLQ